MNRINIMKMLSDKGIYMLYSQRIKLAPELLKKYQEVLNGTAELTPELELELRLAKPAYKATIYSQKHCIKCEKDTDHDVLAAAPNYARFQCLECDNILEEK